MRILELDRINELARTAKTRALTAETCRARHPTPELHPSRNRPIESASG